MADLPSRPPFDADGGDSSGEEGWGSPVPAEYGSLRAVGPPGDDPEGSSDADRKPRRVSGRVRSTDEPEPESAARSMLRRLQSSAPGSANRPLRARTTDGTPVRSRRPDPAPAAAADLFPGGLDPLGVQPAVAGAPGLAPRRSTGRTTRPADDELSPRAGSHFSPERPERPDWSGDEPTIPHGSVAAPAGPGLDPLITAPIQAPLPTRERLRRQQEAAADLRRPGRLSRKDRKAARRAEMVRTRATVRHIDILTVLRISLVFWVILIVMVVFASILLYYAADAFGTLPSLEKSIRTLFDLKSYTIHPKPVAEYTAAGGVILATAGTIANLLGALVYNLISDLVGGVRVEMDSFSSD